MVTESCNVQELFMDGWKEGQHHAIIQPFSKRAYKKTFLLKALKGNTVKPPLSSNSKEDQILDFKTDYCLMQVKSTAECSKRAFCNTCNLH